jgi:hypothetical protein
MSHQSPSPDGNDGRLMLAVGGLLFIPIAVAGVYAVLFKLPKPQGFAEWAVRCLLGELAVSGLAFFTVGFLWAISGNRRLRRLLDTAAMRLAWILILMAIPAFAAAACIVLFGK